VEELGLDFRSDGEVRLAACGKSVYVFPDEREKVRPEFIPVEMPQALKAGGGFPGADGFAQPAFEPRFLFPAF
jgi:hypothetical protein